MKSDEKELATDAFGNASSQSVSNGIRVVGLFVDPSGIYPKMLSECWDEKADARKYRADHPVVAHPPCARWSRLAESVQSRFAHYRVGDDDGCFESALENVRRCGGVLEHPAETKAWPAFGLTKPTSIGWQENEKGGWVCEVWQSAYGHLATKRTWLLYVGNRPPFELDWRRQQGSHVVGGDSKKRKLQLNPKPRLTRSQNIATPSRFAQVLIALAAHSIGR